MSVQELHKRKNIHSSKSIKGINSTLVDFLGNLCVSVLMRTADIFVGSCESEFTLVLHSATELYSVGCGKE